MKPYTAIFDFSLLLTPIAVDAYKARTGIDRWQLHIFGLRVASWTRFRKS